MANREDFMKSLMRLIIVVIVIVIGGICVSSVYKNSNEEKMIGNGTIRVKYKTNSIKIIIYDNFDKEKSYISFDENKKIKELYNIRVVDHNILPDINDLQNILDIKNILGEPHADIGSGLYIPAYIFDDGSIAYFCIANDNIFNIRICSIFDF